MTHAIEGRGRGKAALVRGRRRRGEFEVTSGWVFFWGGYMLGYVGIYIYIYIVNNLVGG